MKCFLQYLRGTTNVGLISDRAGGARSRAVGYVCSDYASDLNKTRPLTSYMSLLVVLLLI